MNKNKKGLTLIELLIVIALIGLISTAAFSMNIFGAKTFKRSEERADRQFELRMVADFITRKVRYAKTVEILNSVPLPSARYCDIYLQDGAIIFNNNGVRANVPGAADASDFTLSFTRDSVNMLGFEIGKADDENLNMESSVGVLNLSTEPPYEIKDALSGDRIGIRFTLGEMSDSDAVRADRDWLDIPDAGNVTSNLFLPEEGPSGTKITWNSSSPAVVQATGLVTRPLSDTAVTLTATISKGTQALTKSFSLLVKAGVIEASPAEVMVNQISISTQGGVVEVKKGNSLQLYANVLPSNAANKRVKWSMVGTAYGASVNSSGLLSTSRNNSGIVTVEARALDGSNVYGRISITIKSGN